MRYPVVVGASVLAAVVIVAWPTFASAQSTKDKLEQKVDKLEQKAEKAGDKAKSVAQDAKGGISDSWLTAKTKIALFADERVKGRDVSVETMKGTVMLRGKVDSDAAKSAAESIAKGIEGVLGVKNELQVVPPPERKMVDANDKDITKAVEARLARDPQTKKIDVRTDAGVVFLTGQVASIATSARASEMAREVPGVRSVKNDLTYPSGRERSSMMRPAPGADRLDRMSVTANPQVKAMQEALKEKGFDPGPIDGIMGPQTSGALKEYQKSQNLQVTGQLDNSTAAKLQLEKTKRQSP